VSARLRKKVKDGTPDGAPYPRVLVMRWFRLRIRIRSRKRPRSLPRIRVRSRFRISHPRPSGPPLAAQRRLSSAVIRGGRKVCDHAARAPAASYRAGTDAPDRPAARVARQRHCVDHAAWPEGRSGTMACPARPGGGRPRPRMLIRIRFRKRPRSLPRIRVRSRFRISHPRPSGPPSAVQRRPSSAVIRGGRKMCDHAARAPAACFRTGAAAPERSAARVARQRHCVDHAAKPEGRSGTMACPARPGGGRPRPRMLIRIRSRKRPRSLPRIRVRSRFRISHPRPSGPPSAVQRRPSSVVIRGGRRVRDHAARSPAASFRAGTDAPDRPAARVARQRHCVDHAAWPEGRSGTMACPARPGERLLLPAFIARQRGGGGARWWL